MTKIHTNRKLLVLLVAVLLGLVTVEAAPAATKAQIAARSPFELPKQYKATLPFSFGKEAIPVTASASGTRAVVYSQTVDFNTVDPTRQNVLWSRLNFDAAKTVLRKNPNAPKGFGENLPGDLLRITSLADNAVQYHNADTLAQWNFRSAFFNGAKVKVELLADPALPSATKPAVIVASVVVNTERGGTAEPVVLPPPTSQCNAVDTRKASSDNKQGRIFPVGCTGWVIDDKNGCQLTAGHCFDGVDATELVLQSNVPLTNVITVSGTKVGVPRHPAPQFQYAVDTASVQFKLQDLLSVDNAIDAEDWAYFGTHPNPNTGLTFKAANNNKTYKLAKVDASGKIAAGQGVTAGATVSITGYGIVRDANRKQFHLAQQSATGKLVSFEDIYHFNHRADTEGGNSGSAGLVGDVAIGIHTNGGCSTSDRTSANFGSTVAMRGLRQALANPKGVCA
ncbi:hypothetical protein H9P43_003264 [Blastocladiella emersonii ATCC 22665]|nr:hypothetical protein H9P43_003264 [Blastocladiella emersonii ATCC 22665]